MTSLESLASDKHSSLLRKIVTYGRKSFSTLAPGLVFEKVLKNLNIIFTVILDMGHQDSLIAVK
jgi:hypothetical protein